MSTGPFFAAAAGQLFLGERVPARTWFAIAVALAGVVLMFTDGLGTGQLAGNLLALGVPIAFAPNVVVLRRYRASVDLVPSVLIAGVLLDARRRTPRLALHPDRAGPRRARRDGLLPGRRRLRPDDGRNALSQRWRDRSPRAARDPPRPAVGVAGNRRAAKQSRARRRLRSCSARCRRRSGRAAATRSARRAGRNDPPTSDRAPQRLRR